MDSDNINIHITKTNNDTNVIQTNLETPIIFEKETECALVDLKLTNLGVKNIAYIDDLYKVRYIMFKLDDERLNKLMVKSNGVNIRDERDVQYLFRFTYKYFDDLYYNIKKIVQDTNEEAIREVNGRYNNVIPLNQDLSGDIVTSQYIIEPIVLIDKTGDKEFHARRLIGRIKFGVYTSDPLKIEYVDVFQYFIEFYEDFKRLIKFPFRSVENWYEKQTKDLTPYLQQRWKLDGPVYKPNIAYLHCDIVKNSFLGVEKTDVMQVIYYNNNKNFYDIEYPLYLPIKHKEISSINIKFCDAYGEPITIKHSNISLLLSFRPL